MINFTMRLFSFLHLRKKQALYGSAFRLCSLVFLLFFSIQVAGQQNSYYQAQQMQLPYYQPQANNSFFAHMPVKDEVIKINEFVIQNEISNPTTSPLPPAKATLEQVRNGSATGRVDPGAWAAGNLNGSQAHYAEKWSIPYRLIMTGLSLGSHTVIIEWDVKQGNKNALDYITHYFSVDNPDGSHLSTFNHVEENIDPTIGFSGLGAMNQTTIAPPPGAVAAASFNALPDESLKKMSMWNGTFTSLTYGPAPNLALSAATQQLTIVFTAASSTVIIAWGGHIASEADWGPGNSASSISGSPYHTRLVSLDGSGGNQDRSLSADAVIDPPTCSISGLQSVQCNSNNTYTTAGVPSGYDYAWTFTNNTSGASFVTGTQTSTSVTVNSGSNVCGKGYTVAYTISKNGVQVGSPCTLPVTVVDNTAPSITCPGPVTVQCASDVPVVNTASVTTSDNCSGTVTVAFVSDAISNSTCSNRYTITRTYKATDVCGNTATCSQIITVNDDTPPSITCPATVDVKCASEVPAPNTSLVTKSDNCAGTVTVTHVGDVVSNQTCANQYTITRTYKATDACGNTATCAQTINVNDDIAPSVTCPGPITVQCASDVPQPNISLVTASDNCGGTITKEFVSDVISNQTCANKYTITRTYKATDVCGNTATCSQIITVNDDIAPSITCSGPVTVQCASDVPVVNIESVTTSDNCAGTVTVTHVGDVISGQTCANKYTITRTYKATDVCGNTATCSQIITVNDNTAPSITCPAPVTVQCASDVPAVNTESVTTTDNCAGTVNVAHVGDVISGQTCANKYTITRTYKATDVCGNTATCSQIITVNDNTPPSITCPAPVTVQCASDVPAVSTASVTTSDNCSGTVTVTHEGDVISDQACANKYTITRTYKATDVCGNTATCSQIITVNDDTPPAITCPGPVTVQCASDVPAVSTASVTTSDNCAGTIAVTHVGDVVSNQTCTNKYTITRTYKATDVCGNTATCSQIITVNDDTPPSITCPAPVTVECESEVPAVNIASVITSDNCAGTVTVTHVGDVISDQTCANKYTITRTYKATDVCGNTATCSQIISVNDITIPTFINCPANATFECLGDVPVPANVTATDNCGGSITPTFTEQQSNPGNGCNNVITRTWTATDACGNTNTCVQLITVKTKPVIECPSDITIACGASTDPSNTGIAKGYSPCLGITITYTDANGAANDCGGNNIIRTWKVTDAGGNTNDCVQTISFENGGATINQTDNGELSSQRSPVSGISPGNNLRIGNEPKVIAYPNPFDDRVKFVITAPVAGYGSLDIMNMLGQKVKTVYQGQLSAGTQSFELVLPGSRYSTLFYILRINGKQLTGKLIQRN